MEKNPVSNTKQWIYNKLAEDSSRCYFTTETYKEGTLPLVCIEKWNSLYYSIGKQIYGFRLTTKRNPRYPYTVVAIGKQSNGTLHTHTAWKEDKRWADTGTDFVKLYMEKSRDAGIRQNDVVEVYSSGVIEYMCAQTVHYENLENMIIFPEGDCDRKRGKSTTISLGMVDNIS